MCKQSCTFERPCPRSGQYSQQPRHGKLPVSDRCMDKKVWWEIYMCIHLYMHIVGHESWKRKKPKIIVAALNWYKVMHWKLENSNAHMIPPVRVSHLAQMNFYLKAGGDLTDTDMICLWRQQWPEGMEFAVVNETFIEYINEVLLYDMNYIPTRMKKYTYKWITHCM